MARIRYGMKLFQDFVGFARQNGTYWIIPLIVALALAALVVVVGEAAAPLLYTLF